MASYQGFPEDTSNDYDRLASSISSNIQKISTKVNQCQRLVDQLGTPRDRGDLTGQIQEIHHSNNELAKKTNTQLRNLADSLRHAPASVKRQRELQKSRLTDEFTSVLNKVQKVQREAADKEKASVRRARTNSASTSNPFADPDDYSSDFSTDPFSAKLVPKKQSMQAVLEEEDNLTAIQERESAIKSLESDILDVNQIFKDLGSLVYEQGEMIDSIESNVEATSVHVEEANVQLETARNYQSAARKKKCICVIILIVALGVVAAIIAIVVVSNNNSKKSQ
ncbi:syntaxin-7-like isoform X3 [Watersipora subatra]|uniref:syntaxin-7-like isoform X3 n=1 Tax=Watersipora subatra TaxID=2589382 RepID=UPI00355B4884